MPSRANRFRTLLMIAAGCACAVCAGCATNRVAANVPVSAAPQPQDQRPMNVAPDTDASPPQPAPPLAPRIADDAGAPDLLADLPRMKMPSAPARRAAERPAGEHEAGTPDHATAPQIVPQVSPAAQLNYQRQTESDLGVAQQNIAQAEKRQLNSSQRDLLENVRTLIKQSGDASKGGDWARAQNLAQKARVLSVELINSL